MKTSALKYEQSFLKLDPLLCSGSPQDLADKYSITLPDNIRNATNKRAFEYLGGRICASQALRAMGCCEVGQLLSTYDRIIDWPAGYRASISHSAGMATAVAVRSSDILSIGVDLELAMSGDKASRLAPRLLTSEEIHGGIIRPNESGIQTTLIFSAKESLFKCLYPIIRVYFGFQDASCIKIDHSKSTMVFKLNRQLSDRFHLNYQLDVWFKVKGNFVETLCWVQ